MVETTQSLLQQQHNMATPVISNIDNTNHSYQADGVSYALDPKTNLYQEASKISPAVVTSKAATTDINNIQADHANIVAGMQNQAVTNANAKAVADAAAATKATTDTANSQADQKLAIDKQTADAKTAAVSGTTPTADITVPSVGQSVYNPLTGKTTTVSMIAKNGDGSYSVTFGDTQNTQRVEAAQLGNLTSSTGKIDGTEKALQDAQADYQVQAKQVQDTITNITNGTIPLNDGQLAQVDGLKQQFQQLIQQQQLINTGAQGAAAIRGYQKGAAEYDPNFAVKTIGAIVTAGTNKVLDLNVKMASAVAALTEGFKTNNINSIKEAYSVYQDASAKRTAALQKTIDDSQKVIKEAQDAKIAADKVTYDTVTKPINDVAADAAKNGAPKTVIDAIKNYQDAGAAIAAAGQYLQTATGTVGEYQYYKNQEEAAGRVPMSFNTYQNLDANRKVSIAKATSGTASDKKANSYVAINQLLGTKNSEGMPYLDGNGYFTAKGFKDIVLNAAEDGISKQDILSQYGSFLSPNGWQNYGLTPKEATSLGFK